MVYVTAIHLVGGTGHEHISDVKWRNPSTGATGESTRAAMVTFVDDGNQAKVQNQQGGVDATVGVVRPSTGSPYLRTYADGAWNNNLLALPQY